MILLDTNVVSEPLRPVPARRVIDWLDAHHRDCVLSSITVLELTVGVQMLAPGRRRERLANAVGLTVERFQGRILPFDEAAARDAALLLALARDGGLPLHQMPSKLADLQIAGIAMANQCALASRNIGDFQGLGIDLIDPWTPSASSPG